MSIPALTSLLARDQAVPVRKIEEAIQRQVVVGGDIASALLEADAIAENVLAAYAGAVHAVLPATRDEVMRVARDIVRLVPREIAEKHRIVPLALDGRTLLVALAAPLPRDAEEQLGFLLGFQLVARIVCDVRVSAALLHHYSVEPPIRHRRLIEQLRHRDAGVVPYVAPLSGARLSDASQLGRRASDWLDDADEAEEEVIPVVDSRSSIPPSYAPRTSIVAEGRGTDPIGIPRSVLEERSREIEIRPASREEPFAKSESDPPAREPSLEEALGRDTSYSSNADTREVDGRVTAPFAIPGIVDRHSLPKPVEERVVGNGVELVKGRFAAPPPRVPSMIPADDAEETVDANEAPTVVGMTAPTTLDDERAIRRRRAHEPLHKLRLRGPLTAANAVALLADAREREDVLEVLFAFARQFFDYAALFTLTDDVAEGREAFGQGTPSSRVRELVVSLDRPSVFRDARTAPVPRVVRLDETTPETTFGIWAELGRAPSTPAVVFPIGLRGRGVLVVYGDRGGDLFELNDLPELVAFVPRVLEALEQIILRRKSRRAGQGAAEPARAPRPSIDDLPATRPVPVPSQAPATPRATKGSNGDRWSSPDLPAAAPSRESRPNLLDVIARSGISQAPPPPRPVADAAAKNAPIPQAASVPSAASVPGAASVPSAASGPSTPMPSTSEPSATSVPAARATDAVLELPAVRTSRAISVMPPPPSAPPASTPAPRLERESLDDARPPRAVAGKLDVGLDSPFEDAAVPGAATAEEGAAVSTEADPVESRPVAFSEPTAGATAPEPYTTHSDLPPHETPIELTQPKPRTAPRRSGTLRDMLGVPRAAPPPPSSDLPLLDVPKEPAASAPVDDDEPELRISTTDPTGVAGDEESDERTERSTVPVGDRATHERRARPSTEASYSVRDAAVDVVPSRSQRPARPPSKPPQRSGPAPRSVRPEAEDSARRRDPRRENSEPPPADVVPQAAARMRPPTQDDDPSVIVDMGDAILGLMENLFVAGPDDDRPAVEALLRAGEQALPMLSQAFPGPLWFDRRRPYRRLPLGRDISPVARALYAFGERSTSYIVSLLGSTSPDRRFYAALLAIDLRGPGLVGAIVSLTFDEDAGVRELACEALPLFAEYPEMADQRLVLRRVARLRGKDPARRLYAIDALAGLRDEGALNALSENLDDDDSNVIRTSHDALVAITMEDLGTSSRRWAAWIERQGQRHRLEWLIDALVSSDEELRERAGDELKTITQQYFGFHAAAPRREREVAQQKYRAWWDAEGRALFAPRR